MVHLHTNKAVIRVKQSKVRRDDDEWHDVSIPNLDEAKEEITDGGRFEKEKIITCCVKDVLVNKHFGFTMIRSVMFWSCLAAAPATVG